MHVRCTPSSHKTAETSIELNQRHRGYIFVLYATKQKKPEEISGLLFSVIVINNYQLLATISYWQQSIMGNYVANALSKLLLYKQFCKQIVGLLA